MEFSDRIQAGHKKNLFYKKRQRRDSKEIKKNRRFTSSPLGGVFVTFHASM